MRYAILFLALVLAAPSLPAEEIILIDGRYLHVKILEANEQGVRVQLLDGGGEVMIPWGLIHEPVRKELELKHGLRREERVIVEEGHQITTKRGDVWRGRIVNDGPDEIRLKQPGSEMAIPKAVVREVEPMMVDVRDIYSPEEYYNKRAEEMKIPDDDIPGNMELGELANDLGLYEKAFAHFRKVQDTDPGYQPDYLANMMKRLEELSKNKQIRDLLNAASRATFRRQYAEALTQLEALIALPGIPAELKAEADVLKDRALKARYDHYRRIVRYEFEGLVKNKIRTMSRQENLKLDEARRRLRMELHKEVIAEIAANHALNEKEVEQMWKDRGFHQPRTATYGSGSFIVLGRAEGADKLEQDMNRYIQEVLRNQQRNGNDQGGSISAQPERLPKPPTKEEWWGKVSTSQDREHWMLAFWVENAKQVEVVGDRWDPCGRCGATGSLKFSGSQGDVLRAPCPTCQGHKRHKGVAYK